MDEKKKLIDELKQIMLDMYRNAGELDRFIQNLEWETDGRYSLETSPKDPEYLKMFIQAQYAYRMDQKRVCSYSSLDARENSVWQRLILEADPDRVNKEQES